MAEVVNVEPGWVEEGLNLVIITKITNCTQLIEPSLHDYNQE